jgi:hypothetical protein
MLEAERSGRPSKLNDKKLVDISDSCCGIHQNHCTTFQQLLQLHSDFPTADVQKLFANEIKRVQACIDPRGHHFQQLL